MKKDADLLKKLEEYRLRNRISQEGLAKLLNVHFTTVNRWLRGHQQPNSMQAYQIKALVEKGGSR